MQSKAAIFEMYEYLHREGMIELSKATLPFVYEHVNSYIDLLFVIMTLIRSLYIRSSFNP